MRMYGLVQAVLIHKNPKTKYHLTKKQSLDYVRSLRLKPIKKVHETKNYYRYRIRQPKLFRRFVTKRVDNIITLIIGYK